MQTLDGVDRELTTDMLMITDTGGPIALGGIMGGAETEINDDTTNVLLESANFYFINNRRTAQALKLPSEATARFGRGVPASGTVTAAPTPDSEAIEARLRQVAEYIDGDHTQWEHEPLSRLAAAGELMAYRHESFWQCMDTQAERDHLNELWAAGAPWALWEGRGGS